MRLLLQLTVGLQAGGVGMQSKLRGIIVKMCLFPLLHKLTFLFMVFYHSWKIIKILGLKFVLLSTDFLTKQFAVNYLYPRLHCLSWTHWFLKSRHFSWRQPKTLQAFQLQKKSHVFIYQTTYNDSQTDIFTAQQNEVMLIKGRPALHHGITYLEAFSFCKGKKIHIFLVHAAWKASESQSRSQFHRGWSF